MPPKRKLKNRPSSVVSEAESPANDMIKFGDVQDALQPFTGDGNCSVMKWLNDFEEMALLYTWSDLHKFVYCKRLLLGTAQSFVRFEDGLNSWKVQLLDEFRSRLTAADVHRALSSEVLQPSETLLQFLYRMHELAMQGGVPDDSLIDYIICGIPDPVVNKSVLYGATLIPEFKVNLEVYGRMCERRNDETKSMATTRRTPVLGGPVAVPEARCYNCGDRGHQSWECPDSGKGPKCFACRAYGHKSFACPSRSEVQPVGSTSRQGGSPNVYQVNIGNTHGRIVKPVCILGREALALVDTGCDINLCRESFVLKLEDVVSTPSRMQLSGPAGTCFFTKYWFEGKLIVNGENYEIGMYSVPDDAIGYDIILGRTLFQTDAVLKVSPHAVTITHVDTTHELMNISASIDELDISMRAFAT
ncbi:CCHC-type zinc finger protein CG3800-like [Aphis craccivora]|uniref:CCHC-type zinc finger protein CG3800-like n=1 Tax=Aphis craccivora TaxID=307492 RepID=A0A6G0X7X5_APHCR|nr:CCHC-type zinc finger protein CG3800-like [Aphis craccivora]